MMHRLAARLPFLLLLTALVSPGGGAARAQDSSGSTPDTKRVVPYRIIVNDSLGVHIFQEDLGLTVRVDSKGDINLNLVGPVHVYGMTLPEAEATIAKAYVDARYLVHPQVTLTVDGLAPRRVSVQGYVKNPSVYDLPIETATTLIDMIAKAGGFADSAKGTAVKVTRVLPDGTIKVFEVDADDVMKGREKDKAKIEQANMVLEPGDIIYVPERII